MNIQNDASIAEQQDNNQLNESDQVEVIDLKKKTITKNYSNVSYANFYRQTYKRLHEQHTRWSSVQITSIIKLEWKKRKAIIKYKSQQFKQSLDARKTLRGKTFYRKSRGLRSFEASRRWFRFTQLGKVYWTNKSRSLQSNLQLKQKYTTSYKGIPQQSTVNNAFELLKKIK